MRKEAYQLMVFYDKKKLEKKKERKKTIFVCKRFKDMEPQLEA